jgi:hypothetical protein
MSIIYKKIDTEAQVEHCWYKSSNIYYTKADFSKSEKKTLSDIPGINLNVPILEVTVVFNRGAQYLYKGVEIHDYISFREVLNREDSTSHGKAFTKFIKPYPFEKLDDIDINENSKMVYPEEYILKK